MVRWEEDGLRRQELPAPAFNAIMEALEAQGRPLDRLAPEDRIFDIAHLDGLKPHDLRHTAAKLRREHGASIEDVSAFLGHRSIATTARYLARMKGEQDNGWQGVAQVLGWRNTTNGEVITQGPAILGM